MPKKQVLQYLNRSKNRTEITFTCIGVIFDQEHLYFDSQAVN